ncbi:hypothetical protein [Methylobacterium aquaticum]|uniref:Uncharacterized protein n=1 Tax=Methylobacterium aquaticum TaxID=270351 RepID=A0A0C6G2L5_9HYPH|nr:hypothetical protein [Methylobacterium aquaticum]BAQ50395.1 hypothetical protein Maq22A_4p60205 [Methylobacterium aquaticum]
MPTFTLATAPHGRSVHLVPEGAPHAWCGCRADRPAPAVVRLTAVCRRCWGAAPAEGKRAIAAAAVAPRTAG